MESNNICEGNYQQYSCWLLGTAVVDNMNTNCGGFCQSHTFRRLLFFFIETERRNYCPKWLGCQEWSFLSKFDHKIRYFPLLLPRTHFMWSRYHTIKSSTVKAWEVSEQGMWITHQCTYKWHLSAHFAWKSTSTHHSRWLHNVCRNCDRHKRSMASAMWLSFFAEPCRWACSREIYSYLWEITLA